MIFCFKCKTKNPDDADFCIGCGKRFVVDEFKEEDLKKIEVPSWYDYYPELNQATAEQRNFYKKWVLALEKGIYINLKHNLSYIFVYLYSAIHQFISDNDINHFLECFDRIESNYAQQKIDKYIIEWKSDAYYLLGDYEKSMLIKQEIGFNFFDLVKYYIVTTEENEDRIDGIFLVNLRLNILTDFGEKNKKEIAFYVDEYLKGFTKIHGQNFYDYYLKHVSKQKDSTDFLFNGVPNIPKNNNNISRFTRNNNIFLDAIKKMLRECENALREKMGISLIGEGWVSETELYYKIKESFPDEIVVHHGKPPWLGRQHLDVYFPEKNIGIEYQGVQHDEPIEYFGGDDGLLNRKKLDERKRTLCEEHNCHLIYVSPDYSFVNVKKDIKRLI